jgi:NAD(P)-dependent dehydrogenase (short-subunit alcohol dehydrogenase family)
MSEASGKKIVLVTGATGRVGKEVVARLAKQDGFIVRAATRDKAAYATALGGVVHVDAPWPIAERRLVSNPYPWTSIPGFKSAFQIQPAPLHLGAHETVTFDLEDKATWAPAMEVGGWQHFSRSGYMQWAKPGSIDDSRRVRSSGGLLTLS